MYEELTGNEKFTEIPDPSAPPSIFKEIKFWLHFTFETL